MIINVIDPPGKFPQDISAYLERRAMIAFLGSRDWCWLAKI